MKIPAKRRRFSLALPGLTVALAACNANVNVTTESSRTGASEASDLPQLPTPVTPGKEEPDSGSSGPAQRPAPVQSPSLDTVKAPAFRTVPSAYVIGSGLELSWNKPAAASGAVTYELEFGSTPGAKDVGTWSGDAETYSAATCQDGHLVFVRLRAVAATGQASAWVSLSNPLTCDLSVTAAANSLAFRRASADASAFSLTPAPNVFAVWQSGNDAGSGFAAEDLLLFADGACGGTALQSHHLSSSGLALNLPAAGNYSFKIRTQDIAGNTAWSACSPPLVYDNAAPPAPLALTGLKGINGGAVHLSWSYPANISDYSSLTLRRTLTATPPADCDDGTDLGPVSYPSQISFEDTGLTPGAAASYRLCAKDAAGNTASAAVANKTPNAEGKILAATIPPLSDPVITDSSSDAIAVDTNGDYYIATTAEKLTAPASGADMRVRKYTSAGVEITTGWPVSWAVVTGMNLTQDHVEMAIDSQGAVYVVSPERLNYGNFEVRLFKIPKTGGQVATGWPKAIVLGDQYAYGRGLAIDASDNVYVIGDATNLAGGTSARDWWIKKYSANGTEITAGWNKTIDSGAGRNDYGMAIAVDHAGNVYAIGEGQNLVNGSSGSDLWIKKFAPDGTEITAGWNQTFDFGPDFGFALRFAATVDAANRLYVLAQGKNILSASSGTDWNVQRFQSDGTLDWSTPIGFGTSGGTIAPYAIDLDDDGDVYAGGVAYNTRIDWSLHKLSGADGSEISNGAWPKVFDSGNYDFLEAVKFNPVSAQVIVAGSGQNLINPSPYGFGDQWVKVFSKAGAEDPSREIKAAQTIPGEETVTSVAIAGVNHLFVLGMQGDNTYNRRSSGLRKFDASGVEVTAGWSKLFSFSGTYQASYFVIKSADDNIYASYATPAGSIVKKYAPDGSEIVAGWNKNLGDYQNFLPAIDSAGNLYLSGLGNNLIAADSEADVSIRKFAPDGTEITAGWNIKIDGGGVFNKYDYPLGVAIDHNDALYTILELGDPVFAYRVVIKKFAANGAEDVAGWDKTLPSGDFCYFLSVDSANRILAQCRGAMTNYIKRYASDGTDLSLPWHATIDQGQIGNTRGMIVDEHDAIYILGIGNCGDSNLTTVKACVNKWNADGTSGTHFGPIGQGNVFDAKMVRGADGTIYVVGTARATPLSEAKTFITVLSPP